MEKYIGFMLVVLALSFVATIALIGASINQYRFNEMKRQCAKQHNVYECVIVAVPKEVGDVKR